MVFIKSYEKSWTIVHGFHQSFEEIMDYSPIEFFEKIMDYNGFHQIFEEIMDYSRWFSLNFQRNHGL